MNQVTSFLPPEIATLKCTPSEKLVLIFISSLKFGLCMSYTRMAQYLNLSVKTCSRACNNLIKNGYLLESQGALIVNQALLEMDYENCLKDGAQTEFKYANTKTQLEHHTYYSTSSNETNYQQHKNNTQGTKCHETGQNVHQNRTFCPTYNLNNNVYTNIYRSDEAHADFANAEKNKKIDTITLDDVIKVLTSFHKVPKDKATLMAKEIYKHYTQNGRAWKKGKVLITLDNLWRHVYPWVKQFRASNKAKINTNTKDVVAIANINELSESKSFEVPQSLYGDKPMSSIDYEKCSLNYGLLTQEQRELLNRQTQIMLQASFN